MVWRVLRKAELDARGTTDFRNATLRWTLFFIAATWYEVRLSNTDMHPYVPHLQRQSARGMLQEQTQTLRDLGVRIEDGRSSARRCRTSLPRFHSRFADISLTHGRVAPREESDLGPRRAY